MEALGRDFLKDETEIRAVSASGILTQTVAAVDSLQQKWTNLPGPYYAHLMLEICNVLNSFDFKTHRQFLLAHDYAKSTLKSGKEMPLDVKCSLVLCMVSNQDYVRRTLNLGDWSKIRTEEVKMLFSVWHERDLETDPRFDIDKDGPSWGVSPPPLKSTVGQGTQLYWSGMPPEAIQDPQQRAEYESAIATNKAKADSFIKQYRLRLTEKTFSGAAERYVTRAYSKEPFALDELRQLLEKFIKDEPRRQHILEGVTEEIQRTVSKNSGSDKQPNSPTGNSKDKDDMGIGR